MCSLVVTKIGTLPISDQDFYDFTELWYSDLNDTDLVMEVESVERYNPLIEDISLDEELLCSALEEVQKQ